jgi:hypothetical protein
VYLSAAPGPIRWHYRQKINALVYQAIVDLARCPDGCSPIVRARRC